MLTSLLHYTKSIITNSDTILNNARTTAEQHVCQPTQTVYWNTKGLGKKLGYEKKSGRQIFTHTHAKKEKRHAEKNKAPHNFPTNKESDFDKWLAILKPGQQFEPAQTDKPTVFMCVWQREKALPWIKTEAPRQQRDKPIYCRCFEKLTGPHTLRIQYFWLSIVPNAFCVDVYAYPCCPAQGMALKKTHFLETARKTSYLYSCAIVMRISSQNQESLLQDLHVEQNISC